MKRRIRVAAGALIFCVLAVFCALRLELSNEITHFLAPGDDPRMAKLSRRLAQAELSRTMILTIAAEDTPRAISTARALATDLAEHEEVAWVRGGWDPAHNKAFYDLYFPRRIFMLSEAPESALESELSDEGLRDSAKDLKRQLALPTAPLVKKLAGADPLLAYIRQIRRLEAARTTSLQVVDDHFVTEDGRAVLFMASRHSPFESAHQRPLQAYLLDRFEAAAASVEGSATLEQSGVGRFALKAEDTIRRDITRISVLSTIGIIALFLLMFRSVRLILLPLVPIAFGVVAATAVSLWVFGSIHGLTLAFGASLIGVAIDYPVHLFNHHFLHPDEEGADGSLKQIRPALLLGALTTVAGFAGLGWTSFPGVREIALFASVGVAGALAATLWLLPALMPARPEATKTQRAAARGLGSIVRWLARHRRLTLIPTVGVLGLCIAAVPGVRWEDDVSALTRLDEDILAEDERVRARVSRMDAGRLVVALAHDDETALARNDEVHARLSKLVEEGGVEGIRSLHTFLWSPALQRANHKVLRDDPEFFSRLDAAYTEEGFRGGAFSEFETALRDTEVEPLSYTELAESPLGELVRNFRTELEGEVGILTFLRGVSDPKALEAAVADLEGVYYFDQKATMARIYGQHRTQALQLVCVGLAGVFLMLWARYRRLRLVVAAFVPALLAGGGALGILSLAGVPLHLLHVVSLLLVLSMGVDYGVFLAEGKLQHEGTAATLLSLAIACLSTVLAFGLLAMSANPALRAVGLTTGIGVMLSLVLAPCALILFSQEEIGSEPVEN